MTTSGLPAIGLRDRKKLRAREAIERSALALFESRGYAGTTLQDIADAADVAPRTFFRYFASKEELLHGDLVGQVPLLAAELASRPSSESILDAVLGAVVDMPPPPGTDAKWARDRRLRLLRLSESDPTMPASYLTAGVAWHDTIADFVRQREPAGDPHYADLFAAAVLACLRVLTTAWARSDGDGTALAPAMTSLRRYLQDGFTTSTMPDLGT